MPSYHSSLMPLLKKAVQPIICLHVIFDFLPIKFVAFHKDNPVHKRQNNKRSPISLQVIHVEWIFMLNFVWQIMLLPFSSVVKVIPDLISLSTQDVLAACKYYRIAYVKSWINKPHNPHDSVAPYASSFNHPQSKYNHACNTRKQEMKVNRESLGC